MKKGLLTLLAASLVFVGCQNYDDQFDDLNAQISALKSQVDGLSSLSGQVASLSGSISGLQAGVTAAQNAASAANTAASAIDLSGLSASLATLQAEVDAVQASLATAATASAVSALQAELDAIEADVDELLSTSNIYSTDVTVSSASTLDAALALGNKLNILNANATITVTAAMDQTKVQTLVNRMNTLTGNLIFNSSSTTETTFNNLTSAADITMNQKGGYQMQALTSAANITLNDQYEANISVIDMRALASVTTITTSGETDAGVQFDQATEVHLSKLTRYPGSQLTIITKKGATLDMPLLDDLNTLGVYEETNLTLNGPAAYTSSLMQDSDQSYTNVATVNVSGNIGDITINAGVETLTITDGVTVTVSAAADDLVTATIDMAADSETTLTAAQTAALRYDADGFVADDKGDLDLTTLANLKTVTISGVAGDINLDQNPNLETVTISADAMDLYLVDNDNMTSVNVTGAKLGSVEVSGHADLTALTLNHTTSLRSSSTSAAEKSVTVNVNTNPSLASLTAGMDDVSGLLVYTNAALATVDFTGLSDDGSETTGYAHIFNNNLTFDLVKDGYDTGTSNSLTDVGSTTGGGGIKTLKTWLQHVDGAVNATYGLYVFIDAITKYEVQSTLNGLYTDTAVPSAPSVTTQATAFSNRTSLYAITAIEAAETATSGTTVRETTTYTTEVSHNSLRVGNTTLNTTTTAEGFTITINGLAKTFDAGDTYNGSTVTTVSDLVSYINGDTSWGSDITVTATNTGSYRSNQEIKFTQGNGSAGAVSIITGGNSGGNDLWYKLGSTYASGQITLTAGEGAEDIAAAVAASISGMANPATQGYDYGATSDGAYVTVTKRVSIVTGGHNYSNDMTTGVTSVPTISFVIDAAQTSTTIGMDAGATSNVASQDKQGWTSGFFLNVGVNNVPGITVKIVNNDNTAAALSGSAVVSYTLSGGAVSGILGTAGAAASRSTDTGNDTIKLVSGTHFSGPNTAYAAVFADVSTATTSTTQVAATTNKSGWL